MRRPIRRFTVYLRLAAPATAFVLLACSLLPFVEPVDARLAVEVWNGFALPPGVAPPPPERVEILVDVTSSMREPTAAGPSRAAAARAAAATLVRALPADTEVGIHSLGIAAGEGCGPAFRVSQLAAGASRSGLLARIGDLRPAGESSLAGALNGLRVFLAAHGALARSRVVVLTDLGRECGGDPCQAVSALVAGGSRVEVVVLGERSAPACLSDFNAQVSWDPGEGSHYYLAPTFRVMAPGATPTAEPVLIAMGRADGSPIAVRHGAAQLVVELDPPLEIGPLELAPGATGRLRILDFPALDPPVREWSWDAGLGEGAGGR